MDNTTRNVWIAIIAVLVIVIGAILIFRTKSPSVSAPASIETGATTTSMTSSSTQIMDTGAMTPVPGKNTVPSNGFDQKG